MLLMGIVFIAYSFIEQMSGNKTTIVLYALFLRALQGIASSTMQVSCYSVGNNNSPNQITEVVAGMEIVTAFAMILGPKISTVIY